MGASVGVGGDVRVVWVCGVGDFENGREVSE
jgi:hypothetical protein